MAVTTAPAAPALTRSAVDVADLSHRYGSSRALDRLSLSIQWDQRVAILGPNGAGKTTLLRILATLVRPTSGHASVGGLELPEQAAAVRRHVGLLAHQTFLYDELTARENLIFYGRLYGLPDPEMRADALLDRVGLADRANSRARTFSRGLQQRLAVARAILHDPSILLLDEPDTGLDLAGADLLSRLTFDDHGQPRTILFTTHNLDRAHELADRAVVLVRGKLILDLPTSDVSVADLAAAVRGDVPLEHASGRETVRRFTTTASLPISSPPGPDNAVERGPAISRVAQAQEDRPTIAYPNEASPRVILSETRNPTAHGVGFFAALRMTRRRDLPGLALAETDSMTADPADSATSSLLGQVAAILRKDLVAELRTRELLGGMLVFALLVLLIFNFALDLRVDSVGGVAPGILWVSFTFAGVIGLGRSFILEKDRGALDGLLVAPIDRGAVYLAKLLGNVFFISVVEAIALPVFISFFNYGSITPELALIVILGTTGFAAVGTLFAAMAANTRAREVMLPVMIFPISIPVVIAAVEATALALSGSPFASRLGWLELLTAFDLIFGILCFVVFDYVVEE